MAFRAPCAVFLLLLAPRLGRSIPWLARNSTNYPPPECGVNLPLAPEDCPSVPATIDALPDCRDADFGRLCQSGPDGLCGTDPTLRNCGDVAVYAKEPGNCGVAYTLATLAECTDTLINCQEAAANAFCLAQGECRLDASLENCGPGRTIFKRVGEPEETLDGVWACGDFTPGTGCPSAVEYETLPDCLLAANGQLCVAVSGDCGLDPDLGNCNNGLWSIYLKGSAPPAGTRECGSYTALGSEACSTPEEPLTFAELPDCWQAAYENRDKGLSGQCNGGNGLCAVDSALGNCDGETVYLKRELAGPSQAPSSGDGGGKSASPSLLLSSAPTTSSSPTQDPVTDDEATNVPSSPMPSRTPSISLSPSRGPTTDDGTAKTPPSGIPTQMPASVTPSVAPATSRGPTPASDLIPLPSPSFQPTAAPPSPAPMGHTSPMPLSSASSAPTSFAAVPPPAPVGSLSPAPSIGSETSMAPSAGLPSMPPTGRSDDSEVAGLGLVALASGLGGAAVFVCLTAYLFVRCGCCGRAFGVTRYEKLRVDGPIQFHEDAEVFDDNDDYSPFHDL